MRRLGFAVLAALGVTVSLHAGTRVAAQSPTKAPAAARDGWRQEFEEVCAKTQDAMALTTEELRALVSRCDGLKPAIDRLAESERKVYAKRLAGCRSLYAYVLESREAGQAR